MQPWTQLSRLALIGTEHQAPVPATLGDATLDDLLTKIGPVEERELHLLKTAAALTLARRAGYQPGNTTPIAFAAEPETQPRCPDPAGADLARLLRDYLPQILPEWLELAAAHNVRAPEESLPELLERAKGKRDLRPLLKPVLGQRGAWLAAQNPDWAFAIRAGGDERVWHEGKRAERLAVLREIREAAPALALELLAATWKDETPEDRAEFIATFATGLSLDDESFLENALDDKRKEVRTHALRLLGSLPGSKLVGRLTALATPLIVAKKQLLRSTSLDVSLPAEPTKEMKRDGIGATKSPGKEIGEKAWWLKEMLEAIPPAHWTATLKLSANDLIAAAQKSEFKAALLKGWSEATVRYADPEWATAWLGQKDLLAYAPKFAQHLYNDLGGLEKSISALIRQGELSLALLDKLPPQWSKSLSQQIIYELQNISQSFQTDYVQRFNWKSLLDRAALAVPPDLALATTGWPKHISQQNVRDIIDEFCAIIEFRRNIHRHFQER